MNGCSLMMLKNVKNRTFTKYLFHFQIDLFISMEELCLQLTKYQYHDFMMLLQQLEYMARASQFRKYKARHGLENLPNYNGRHRHLWKFAFDCVYEEEVMRRINNWSWEHMKNHVKNCKEYRRFYKEKLTSKKISEELLDVLNRYSVQNTVWQF